MTALDRVCAILDDHDIADADLGPLPETTRERWLAARRR
jgi:hypothetical protein